jgi:hypothetical protein
VIQFRDRARSATLAFFAVAVAGLPPFLGRSALAAEAPRTIIVDLDRAKVVSLPRGARQVILGNPIIVGMTQLPDGVTAVLTGKAFGETNLVVLDAKGAIVIDSIIRVEPPSGAGLVVQRGQQRTSYDCASGCELRMQLGDAGEAAQDAGTKIQARNGLATSQPDGPNPSVKSGGAL